MLSYQFINSKIVKRSDGLFVPLVGGNTDCADFLAAWKSGTAIVLNADGSSASYSDAAVIALGLTPPT